jgi:hypothetical protein
MITPVFATLATLFLKTVAPSSPTAPRDSAVLPQMPHFFWKLFSILITEEKKFL